MSLIDRITPAGIEYLKNTTTGDATAPAPESTVGETTEPAGEDLPSGASLTREPAVADTQPENAEPDQPAPAGGDVSTMGSVLRAHFEFCEWLAVVADVPAPMNMHECKAIVRDMREAGRRLALDLANAKSALSSAEDACDSWLRMASEYGCGSIPDVAAYIARLTRERDEARKLAAESREPSQPEAWIVGNEALGGTFADLESARAEALRRCEEDGEDCYVHALVPAGRAVVVAEWQE